MDSNLPVTCSLNSARSGTLTITPVHQGIKGAMIKQKPPSRSSKDYSLMLSIQDKTPILPCWHIGAHPLMPTCVHQLRCYTRGPSAPHYHKGYVTRTPHAADDHDPLNQCATQSAEYHNHYCRPKSLLYAGQTMSLLSNTRTLWLPAKVICQVGHGSYLVQVIGGGQYRHACDHICEYHPHH